MSNDILRAGPFGVEGSANFFVNQPEVGEESAAIVPINCAMNNWSIDAWKTVFTDGSTTDSPPYSDGLIEYISAPFPKEEKIKIIKTGSATGNDPNGNASSKLLFRFMTQATVEFKIIVSAEAEGDVGSFNFGDTGEDWGGPTFSSSQTVTIPPSVLPRTFTASIEAIGTSVEELPTTKLTIEEA